MWNVVNESLSQFFSSNFWDTNLTTTRFERSFHVWIPYAFLWLFLPLEIWSLRRTRTPKIPFTLHKYKIFELAVISLMELIVFSDIVYYTFFTQRRVDDEVYSSVVKFLTICLLLILSYTNIIRGVGRSSILSTFSFLLAFCGIPQFYFELRSVYENKINYEDVGFISYLIFYPLTLILFLLNYFVDFRSISAIANPHEMNICPEEYASFFSNTLLLWFDELIWKGYRTPIRVEDIWELDRKMHPREISQKFERHWYSALDNRTIRRSRSVCRSPETDYERQKLLEYEAQNSCVENTNDKVPLSILGPLFRTFGLDAAIGIAYQILGCCLQFVSPVILRWLLVFIDEKDESNWHGYVYASLLLIVALSQTILQSNNYHRMRRIGIQIRTAVMLLVYKKALKISNGARKCFTHGQIVNLMSVDAQLFLQMMTSISFTITIPLEICLCSYFLWDTLGISGLVGVTSVILVLAPINIAIASRIEKLQSKQMQLKDKRVKLMTEILSGIRVLKLNAWEPNFEKEITKIRADEVKTLRTRAFWQTGSKFVFTCAPFVISLITFAVFVLSSEKNVLDAKIAFISLTLFNLLRCPLVLIPMVVTMNFVQTFVAVKRINKFLNSEELDPHAVTHEPCFEPIIIKNGQFSWDGNEGLPTLCNINLGVKPGLLVAVLGSVGAGKSSLLSAILGEMYKQWGSVNTNGSIAYVPQQAWIRNTTLKNNITFGDETNDLFYQDVIEACALGPDLEALSDGDQSEIGEHGINLSGGQKQRVSLARAVFAKSDIYLLDDPLSAVDSHVGNHIFEKVIGPRGLLRGKTRVLVTHSIAHLEQVDHIVILQDGFISESGTYDELTKKDDFANFLAMYRTKEDNDFENKNSDKIGIVASTNAPMDDLLSSSFLGAHSRHRTVMVELADKKGTYSVVGQKLMTTEKTETGNVKWKVYRYYLSAVGSCLVILTILMSVLYQVFAAASNISLIFWSSNATTTENGHQDKGKQYFYLKVYAGLGLGQAIFTVLQTIAQYVGILKAAKYIHDRLLRSVIRWPVTSFDTTPSGRIINRFGPDVNVLDIDIPLNINVLLHRTGLIVSTLLILIYTTPLFFYVLIPLSCLYVCIQRFYAAASMQLTRLDSVTKSPVYSHFGETISGAASIRAYGLQSNFLLTSEKRVEVNQKCSYISFISRRWLILRLSLIGSSVIFFAAVFVVLERNMITISLVGLSISYALQILESLSEWTHYLTETETNVVAIERLKEYVESEQEASWTLSAERTPKIWPNEGAIAFEDLRMRYRPGLDLTLKGISFRVSGGEKVGIVGRTGAGKSSLTLCLFRLLEPAGGRIIIDGVDITTVGLHTLRARLTIIPQDPVLFTGTLRKNLDPCGAYSDESIWSALELTNLKKMVSNFSSGLEHELTEGGANLSVGQRQLICLTRALLRKTKILILDEATAAIDLESDDLIKAIIKREFEQCTVLTIAHRLNTVLDYDRIIVLDKGHVVENDSPGVLLESKRSAFHKMAIDAGLV